MYCRNCGSKLKENNDYCTTCGCNKNVGNKYCYECGNTIEYFGISKCPRCGVVLKVEEKNEIVEIHNPKSLILAGFLQVFFSFFSLGNFYLGFYKKALVQLIVTLLTFGLGFIWPFIDGLRIFKGKIKVDAYGVPLKN